MTGTIAVTSKQVLEEMVLQLWSKSDGNRRIITSVLSKSVDNARSETREASAWCLRCHRQYDTGRNRKGDCLPHHPGKHSTFALHVPVHLLDRLPGVQEVDYESETWDDHDDCHGDPDSWDLMNGPTHKEGYEMTCCGQRPYEEGCETSSHLSQPAVHRPAKRLRTSR